MNKIIIYKSFNKEMEKNAGKIADAIGDIISKGLTIAWEHPKTTLGLGAGTLLTTRLIREGLPGFTVANELNKRKLMRRENSMLRDLVKFEKLKKTKENKQVKKQKLYKPDLA